MFYHVVPSPWQALATMCACLLLAGALACALSGAGLLLEAAVDGGIQNILCVLLAAALRRPPARSGAGRGCHPAQGAPASRAVHGPLADERGSSTRCPGPSARTVRMSRLPAWTAASSRGRTPHARCGSGRGPPLKWRPRAPPRSSARSEQEIVARPARRPAARQPAGEAAGSGRKKGGDS